MAYPLPPLPYAYNALEPIMDEETMHLHHDKHHQAYTDKMNAALASLKENANTKSLAELGIDLLLTKLDELKAVAPTLAGPLRNNGGGFINHDLFWSVLAPPNTTPFNKTSDIGRAVETQFGGFEKFQEQFKTASVNLFGSGWVWLTVDLATAEKNLTNKPVKTDDLAPYLSITSTPNQDTPANIPGHVPLLTLDVWEHAYYLKYNNRRPEYIDKWWQIVNWNEVDRRFNIATNHFNNNKDFAEKWTIPAGLTPRV